MARLDVLRELNIPRSGAVDFCKDQTIDASLQVGFEHDNYLSQNVNALNPTDRHNNDVPE